jgi:hypothetical protein
LFLGLILAMAILLPPGVANAQVQQGATLTILRGQVALLRASGTAVQPAPSGSTVDVGDEIRTIAKSGALITFFSGTEIEMGEETILVVDQLNRQGDKIDVSLRQVLGTTVNRVQSLTETGSSYSIQAGGAVAVVRGTTFALVGPVTTPAGNVVAMACREDCSPTSTFNGCNMAAFTGYGVSSSNGKVDSGCYTFHVDRADSAADAAHYGVTTVEQALQGDTKTVPAGQIPGGSKQEKGARFDELEREAKQKDLPKDQQVSQQTVQAVPSVAPTQDPPLSPSPPGTRPCNTNVVGGGGVTTTVYELGRTSGSFTFTYQAFSVPDRFQVIYQGVTLLDTGLVSGAATPTLTYSGTATFVTVVVTGSAAGTGTSWDATVGCPF